MHRYVIAVLIAGCLSTGAWAQKKLDDVVVSRGGISVTLQDVDTWVARVPKEQRAMFIDSPTRIQDMLGNLLLTKQLAAQARVEHLDQQPQTSSQLSAAADEVLARARIADFMKTLKVPDLSMLSSEEYTAHKKLYKVPARIDVKQILVTAEKRTDAEAKALADKLRAQAVADPKAFDGLIEQYSDDTSKAQNHGLVQDAMDAKYLEEFRDAAAAMKRVGEVSPVIHTTYGYHILELVLKQAERQQTFDEVRDKINAAMRDQYVANQRRDFINQLTNEKLDANQETLLSLRDRYDDAGNVKSGAASTPAPVPAQAAIASPEATQKQK